MNYTERRVIMKKIIAIFLMMLLLSGCSALKKTTADKSADVQKAVNSNNADDNKIVFADPVFEKYLRKNIGELSGDITAEDISEIKQIELNVMGFFVSYQPYVTNGDSEFNATELFTKDGSKEILSPDSLEDLKYFTNLEFLCIDSSYDNWPKVNNISFLSHMPKIKYVSINDDGKPHDLSPLESCKNLKYLSMNFSQVTDYSAFSKLDNIKVINILSSYEDIDSYLSAIKKNLKSNNVIIGDNEPLGGKIMSNLPD